MLEPLLSTLLLTLLFLLDGKRERRHREALEEIQRLKEEAKRALLSLLSLLVLFLPAFRQSLVGRASVVDGDTLEVHGQRIRLWGIDAVESSQTCLDPQGKPLALGQYLVLTYSDPGGLVVDPFAGSGTFGEAALSLGRRFLGAEKDPRWREMARRRLSAVQGALL